MDISTNKTAVFLEAIRTLADEECEKIDRETAAVRAERTQTLTTEAATRYASFEAYEVARIQADFNREISALQEASRKRLTAQRAEILAQVFQNVRTALVDFSKTPAYEALLLQSAEKAANVMQGEQLQVLLKAADAPLFEKIAQRFSKPVQLHLDDSIQLGGLKVCAADSAMLIDDTLDARLEAQKAHFLAESGLCVEE